jgi:peptidoglycan hydrolase-like protein with peptidoglycan-binding domain
VLLAGALVLLAVVAAGALVLVSARASLTADSTALAKIGLPLGGGTIQSVDVVTGPHSRQVPVELRGQQIYPKGLLAAHELVTIDVVVKRPGWIAWLAGSTQKLHLTVMTPSASLRQHYLTLRAGATLRLQFKQPISVISYGTPGGALQRHVLASPQTDITLSRHADAGSMVVAAAPRAWERATPALVSWFPAGSAASAVANPAPGTQITPSTPITLTFSNSVSAALGSNLPPVSPNTAGTWHTLNSHTIEFQPEGYGYGLAATVSVALPKGVRLVGGQQGGSASTGTWTVPGGSTLRLQQMLALLGYLPLNFNYTGSGVPLTAAAQEAAAVNPPAGKFTWAYSNVPSALAGFWQPGASGAVTRGALMAFENEHGLTADGVAGPEVWRTMIGAVMTGHRSTFGYTFVSVSVGSQSIDVWHNGHTVLTAAVNTGIASAPTATGTYPVFEHIASGTMSGTNPDGSHYNDAGIPWISYFNGGDALHGFTRAQYGSPQSLGCVEMPFDTAGKVYPYTPIGTLVHVA